MTKSPPAPRSWGPKSGTCRLGLASLAVSSRPAVIGGSPVAFEPHLHQLETLGDPRAGDSDWATACVPPATALVPWQVLPFRDLSQLEAGDAKYSLKSQRRDCIGVHARRLEHR